MSAMNRLMRWVPKRVRRGVLSWAKSVSYRTLIGPHDRSAYDAAKQETDFLAANDLYPLVPAVHAGVKAIASALASAPMKVMVNDKLKPNHELTKLLERPNKFDTSYDLLETTGVNLEITGEAHWLMEGVRGPVAPGETPVTLTPLHPNHMIPILDEKEKIRAWKYKVQTREIVFPASSVLFFSFYDPSDPFSIRGLASTRPASAAATLYAIINSFNRGFFERGATLSGVLESENEDVDQDTMDAIVAKFRNDFGSSEQAWKVKGMSHGFKFKPIQQTHTDMLFEKLQGMNQGQMLMSIGVPPVMVTDMDGATYANAEAQISQFWHNTMLPKIRKMEARINRDLASRYGDKVKVFFDLSGVPALQPSMQVIAESGRKMLEVASLTPNEYREWMRTGIVPDFQKLPEGDTVLVSFNLTPVEQAFAEEPAVEPETSEETEEEGVEEAEPEESIEDSVERLITLSKQAETEYVSKQFNNRMERLRRASDKLFKATTVKFFHAQDGVAQRFLNRNEERFEGFRGLVKPKNSSRFKTVTDDLLAELRELDISFKREYEALYSGTSENSGELAMSLIPGALIYVAQTAESTAFAITESEKLIQNISATSATALRNSLADGIALGESKDQLAARITGVVGPSGSAFRASVTGQLESNKSVNFGTLDAWNQTNGLVQRKTWVTQGDDEVRESHEIADGQTVGINDLFQVGSSLLEYPGDTANGAAGDEVANCRCGMFPSMARLSIGDTNGRPKSTQAQQAD